MKRCSALGNGASTLLRQLLCRLPLRCPGPQPSSSPSPPPMPFGRVQLSVRVLRDNSCPYRHRGKRCQVEYWQEHGAGSVYFPGSDTASGCSCSLGLKFLVGATKAWG